MTSALTKRYGNRIVRWLGGETMPAPPAGLYVGLCQGDPAAAGVEVTTSVRVAGRVLAAWTVPAESDTLNELINSADIDFGDSATDVAGITHVGLWDAATAGNLYARKALTAPISPTTGTGVKWEAGDMKFVGGS